MAQPLSELSEQAVGEVLDRIDDDTHEVGTLLRQSVWMALRTTMAAGPLWLVAGLTWWPAFLLFPVSGLAALLVVRRMLPRLTQLKVVEEMAWTDHAAAMEEGVAARDDLRTSLGQPYVLRRCTELAGEVHQRFASVVRIEAGIGRRTGMLLHGVLAATALVGVVLVVDDRLSTASLVTLFLVTTMFVGQVDQLARHLPDLQEGFGAVIRLRGLLASEPEPEGGLALPDGPLSVRFADLHFAYAHGTFALSGVDLAVPAGTTCAFVGRTGSGKSTLASLVSRAVEPERGSLLLGGVDVRELDLQQLRAAVGVVTQRTEILAGTLSENITLFAEVPRETVEAAIDELGPHRLGRGSPPRARHPARARWHQPVGRRGAAGRVRAAAGPRRPGGRARRGDRPDGPAHRGARGRRRRPAAVGSHRPAGRSPPLDDRARRAGRRPRWRPRPPARPS